MEEAENILAGPVDTERQPLNQDPFPLTTVSIITHNDSHMRVKDAVTYPQAWGLLELDKALNAPKKDSCWSRFCRCLSKSPSTARVQLANLKKVEFDPKNLGHQRILNSCIEILTPKDPRSVNLRRPLKFVTKGYAFSLSLQDELIKEGSLLNLLFVVYLRDQMGDELEKRLQAVQTTSRGAVPILKWLNIVNPMVWNYMEKKGGGLGKTVTDAFACSQRFFENWVQEYLNDPELAWYCEASIEKPLKTSRASNAVESEV